MFGIVKFEQIILPMEDTDLKPLVFHSMSTKTFINNSPSFITHYTMLYTRNFHRNSMVSFFFFFFF